MSLLGGVLKAVAGPLVSGLLGGKKKTGVNYVQLRNDALKAGFNPLTVLEASGGRGYERGASADLSSGAFLADAVSRAVDTVFNQLPSSDPKAEAARQYQAARDAGKLNPSILTRAQYAPDTKTFYAGPERSGGPAIKLGENPAPSDTMSEPAKLPLTFFGTSWERSGQFSDQEAWESAYGDIVSQPYGLLGWADDVGDKAGRVAAEGLWRYAVKPGMDWWFKPRKPVSKMAKPPIFWGGGF